MAIPKDKRGEVKNFRKNDRKTSTPPAHRDIQGKLVNPYDNNGEQPFTQIPLDDSLDTPAENYHYEDAPEQDFSSPKKTVGSISTKYDDSSSETKNNNDTEDDFQLVSRERRERQNQESTTENSDPSVVYLKDKDGKRREIDKRKKRLLPFGSSRKQQKLTHDEIDSRKNAGASVKRRQFIAWTALATLPAIGIYNAIPKDGLTAKEQSQTSQIVNKLTGSKGYPTNAGSGIATDFIKAYLTVQSDEDTNNILAYYYTGSMEAKAGASSGNVVARTASSSFSQKLVYPPTVYGVREVTATMASYTVGAYVQSIETNGDKQTMGKPHMIFFNVNVVFDKDNQAFGIAPDSPTVTTPVQVNSQQDLPEAEALGDGQADDALAQQIKSVVNGYVQGYSVSTDADTSALDQYVTSDASPIAKRGLGGSLQLADGTSSITYQAFPSQGDKENVTQIKARVKVQWIDKVKKDSASVSKTPAQITYGSQYVMTLDKQADGRFLVKSFLPEVYNPSKK